MDPLLNRAGRHHASHRHWASCSDAVGSIDGLVFDGGIPPAIKEKNVLAKLKIQSHTARTVAHQYQMLGRIFFELLDDAITLPAPFAADEARRALATLKVGKLLAGARGAPAADGDALCETAARFSALASALAGAFVAIDVNPLIVHARGCVAADALLLVHTAGKQPTDATRHPEVSTC